jgi:hypothetical protein
MEPETETVKVYSSYTEAQKRATKKYRELNKEKVNAQRKKYYDERKAKDPNFLTYKREKAKEYYIKKKGLKSDNQFEVLDEVPEIIEEVKEEVKPELVIITEPEEEEAPPFGDLKLEKPKAPRKPRTKKESPLKENLKPEDLEELKVQLMSSSVILPEDSIVFKEEIIEKKPRAKKDPKEPKTPRVSKAKKPLVDIPI